MDYCVNALSGLYLIVTDSSLWRVICNHTVSMPSRAYTSLLPDNYYLALDRPIVSMPSRAYTSLLPGPQVY